MAKSFYALEDFQVAAEPISFHRFNDISIPKEINELITYRISTRSLVRMFIDLGLINGNSNGSISNDKDVHLIFYHLDDKRVNIS